MNFNEIQKYDVYDSLTKEERETITNIFLEALYREKNIKPEFFSIETNVVAIKEVKNGK